MAALGAVVAMATAMATPLSEAPPHWEPRHTPVPAVQACRMCCLLCDPPGGRRALPVESFAVLPMPYQAS